MIQLPLNQCTIKQLLKLSNKTKTKKGKKKGKVNKMKSSHSKHKIQLVQSNDLLFPIHEGRSSVSISQGHKSTNVTHKNTMHTGTYN